MLIQSSGATVDDPRFKAVVGDVTQRLERIEGVEDLHGPYDAESASAVSEDRHSVLVSFEIPGDKRDAAVKSTVDSTLEQTAAVQRSNRRPPRSSSSSRPTT